MVIGENQIFNLMDTNGRRSDVLNALNVYLEILEELKSEYPTENWSRYPISVAQFRFYERALEKSRDVFKVHRNYDQFISDLGEDYESFLRKDQAWITQKLPHMARMLDEAIEKRARHYTSNLVKMGFTDAQRNITQAGYSYLRGLLQPDGVEAILPLDTVNLALLRQLLKLKVFSQPGQDGKRQYYAPFLMALSLLLDGTSIDRQSFELIVQGLGPYSSPQVKEAVRAGAGADVLENLIRSRTVPIPQDLLTDQVLDLDCFRSHFKSSKNSQSTVGKYYAFYLALEQFRRDPSPACYQTLLTCLEEDGELLQKAFGWGKAVFQIGNRGSRYDLETFLEKNRLHPLLTAPHYNQAVYTVFFTSKWIDGIREYSDTTVRLLSATGLFKFKPLPELAFPEILRIIFDPQELREKIFGELSEQDYLQYEQAENCYFGQSHSLLEILAYPSQRADRVSQAIQAFLGVSTSTAAKDLLLSKKSADFLAYVQKNYPRERVISLLSLFSDCSATSFLRNWDSILEKKRANLRSISEPARLRQPPPRSTGAAHARGRAQSIREERRIAAPPVLFALLWVRLLPALYGPFCGPLRPFGGCPWGVTPPARECLPPAPPDTRRRG